MILVFGIQFAFIHPRLQVAEQSKSVWQARPSGGTLAHATSAIPPYTSIQLVVLESVTLGVISPVGLGYTGHGANSQFGGILPTADPSGHIRASIVQPI